MATSKRTTKKDLENKIVQLEAKIAQLSTKLEAKPEKQIETNPVKKGKRVLPKGFEEPVIETLTTVESDSLEHAYQNAAMTDFHQYRAKVTGYTPAPNRYFVRRTAPVGTVTTKSWHSQKATVAGYTQPSNQYFATRARLAYHPPEKTFAGYDMSFGAGSVQTQTAQSQKVHGTMPKGF